MLRGSILFPHDGSVLAGSVIDSLGLALSAETPVTVLHVDQGSPVEGKAIDQAVERLEHYGVAVTRETLPVGDAAGAIVDYARVHGHTLIALSTQGHGGGRRGTRGSVAERVLQASTVPVFLLPPRAHLEPHFQSILVPVALDSDSLEIFDSLLPLAQSFKSTITLLYVDEEDPTDTAARREERRRLMRGRIEKEFEQARERVESAGVPCHLRIEHGDPDEEILRAAKPEFYDLLAMTTHARKGFSRWLFGSVAQRVLRHAEIPLFVHRIGLPLDS